MNAVFVVLAPLTIAVFALAMERFEALVVGTRPSDSEKGRRAQAAREAKRTDSNEHDPAVEPVAATPGASPATVPGAVATNEDEDIPADGISTGSHTSTDVHSDSATDGAAEDAAKGADPGWHHK